MILTILNNKGGVGKTTTAVNLGKALSMKGKRVSLIDLDSQCNLTDTLATRGEGNIFDYLSGKPLRLQNYGDIKIATASPLLSTLSVPSGAIRKMIEEELKGEEFIIVDCPPSLGSLTIAGIVSSDAVIATLTPEALPFSGLEALEEIVSSVRNSGHQTALSGILITRYNGRTLNKVIEERLREKYGKIVFNTKIRENISLAEAPLGKVSIFDYAPRSNGAKDYLSLAEEILQRYGRNKTKK